MTRGAPHLDVDGFPAPEVLDAHGWDVGSVAEASEQGEDDRTQLAPGVGRPLAGASTEHPLDDAGPR